MAKTYKSIDLDAPSGSGGSSPYSTEFLIATWNLNSPVYEIIIPESTHSKGTILSVQVFERIVSDYTEIETEIEIASNGDVKITITATTDLRFDGRLVILGE